MHIDRLREHVFAEALHEGLEQVRGVLGSMGVEVVPVALPVGVQHLLGAVNIVDRDLAAALEDKLTPEIRTALQRAGLEILALPCDAETVDRRGPNFVALGTRLPLVQGHRVIVAPP